MTGEEYQGIIEEWRQHLRDWQKNSGGWPCSRCLAGACDSNQGREHTGRHQVAADTIYQGTALCGDCNGFMYRSPV